MSSRITDDVIGALQRCRLKAYLLLHGEKGAQSEYEKMLIEQTITLESKAIEKIQSDYSKAKMATESRLSVANLRKGAPFVLNARFEDDRFAVHFDALRKVDGVSRLGAFQYEPVMFCPSRRVRASDRQYLAARAALLARVQGAFPRGAIVYLGRDGARTSIRFGSTLAAAEDLIRDAERLQRAEAPPKLLLNDHCRVCEFRERCRDRAIREDNLSLLRGIGEKTTKTCDKLLAQLIAGPLLHIDETEVKLKDGSGYVWVFASTSATIYIFRRSREGNFLREMLKNFKGVLVSDFYSAYDGLPCSQQRCLIHLMRDMNRAILDNPFDQELQSITTPFGALLRSIVSTIDEYGLTRRNLQIHAKAVQKFFDALAEQVCESDAAKGLQDRLLRNRERLFTFLQHDGVSWNNNLAENAIKRVSYYREDVRRSVKEAGLT